MKDNHGFTLVELIIVMLIMAVLATGAVTGFNLLNAGNAKRAAERVISMLNSVQIDNMTRSKAYHMEITQNASGEYKLSVYYMNGADKECESSETLDLKEGAIITFITLDDNNTDDVSDDVSETITVTPGASDLPTVSFRKDTGAVKAYNADGDKYVVQIGITSAGLTCYIRLVTETGKHFIE